MDSTQVEIMKEDMRNIIKESAQQPGMTVDQLTFIFVTAHIESRFGLSMVENTDGSQYNNNAYLCNRANDGPLYIGRGFKQITGRCNYKYYSDLLGVDLINNPDLVATDRLLAAEIMVHGMANGVFTCIVPLTDRQADELEVTLCSPQNRVTLSAFDSPGNNTYDWYGARDIINEAGPEMARTDGVNLAEERYGPILREGCLRGLLPPGVQCGG
jgi:hypothetical protein